MLLGRIIVTCHCCHVNGEYTDIAQMKKATVVILTKQRFHVDTIDQMNSFWHTVIERGWNTPYNFLASERESQRHHESAYCNAAVGSLRLLFSTEDSPATSERVKTNVAGQADHRIMAKKIGSGFDGRFHWRLGSTVLNR